MRYIIPISGKDSLCTAIVQMSRAPDLPYEFLFCDVRMELPQTYAWLESVERSLGIRLVRVGRSLEDVIAEQGFLPSANKRFCTKYGKIFPMRDFVGKDDAVQYVGFRADEADRTSGMLSPPNITLSYPLVEVGIDLPAVHGILERKGILPPTFFWQRLWDLVWSVDKRGVRDKMINLKPWERSSLFSWRSRSNCFMCFYQRQYEWAGLLEHHPELFYRAMKIEQDYAKLGDRRLNPFYFHEGYSLLWIRGNRDKIVKKRAVAVLKMLSGRKDDHVDLLALTSCGAYCGK